MTEFEMISDIMSFAFIIFMLVMFLLTFSLADRLQRIADRYRLKYSFDPEIEKKEIDKDPYGFKLDKREQKFKRRVFKD